MACKSVSLKPFFKENDSERYYDILRSILIAKKLADRGNINDVQRKKSVSLLRKKISEIAFLKRKYPVISSETLVKIARENQVQFVFWTQQNTVSKPKHVTQIGKNGLIINLKISGYENFDEISYKNLTMLIEIDSDKIYKSLNKKLKKFSSISEALTFFTKKPITETEFLEKWGDHELRFREEERFIELFDIGYSFWSNDLDCKRLRGSWAAKHIPILLDYKKFRMLKLSIFEELTVVIDEKYLKDFRCKYCFTGFQKRFNMLEHEKICQNDTQYKYFEKQYGDHKNIHQILTEENVIPENDESYKNFCSFDIEAINVSESLKIFKSKEKIAFYI